MIPLQDVIPSGRTPLVTIALLGVGAIELLIARWMGYADAATIIYAALILLFLWIFGDNVEGRIGRGRFAVLFVLCRLAMAWADAMFGGGMRGVVLTGGAAAAVMGAYFVLYPRSRVLTFFPVPPSLTEVPAAFYLAVFFVLHVPAGPPALAHVAGAFGLGALLCFVFRKPIVW